jgi:DNA-directed RNA polymerase subunit RPC12/RpoP
MHEPVAELYKLNRHGKCRRCGTALPLSDMILQKFHRCYYCGQHKPFGTDWRIVAAPALVFAALAALTVWWKQTFS